MKKIIKKNKKSDDLMVRIVGYIFVAAVIIITSAGLTCIIEEDRIMSMRFKWAHDQSVQMDKINKDFIVNYKILEDNYSKSLTASDEIWESQLDICKTEKTYCSESWNWCEKYLKTCEDKAFMLNYHKNKRKK